MKLTHSRFTMLAAASATMPSTGTISPAPSS